MNIARKEGLPQVLMRMGYRQDVKPTYTPRRPIDEIMR